MSEKDPARVDPLSWAKAYLPQDEYQKLLDGLNQPLDISIRINPQSQSVSQAPIVARVYFSSLDELNWLAGWLDVWEVNHAAGYILAVLSPQDQQSLLQNGFRIEIDTEIGRAHV